MHGFCVYFNFTSLHLFIIVYNIFLFTFNPISQYIYIYSGIVFVKVINKLEFKS